MEELIILGNGFDISCGLKSRYADFYNYRYTPSFLEKIEDFYIKDSESDTDINFWDVVLASPHIEDVRNADWKDIESLLTKYLLIVNNYGHYLYSVITYYNNRLVKNFPEHASIDDETHYTIVALARISHKKFKKNFGFETGTTDQRQTFFSSVLMEELRKYELCFQQYLANEIEQNSEYSHSCENKLNELIKADKTKFEAASIYLDIKVLTFNYTTPFSVSAPSTTKINRIKNVHGSINKKNIVFGIDEFSEASEDFVKFTKTYRALSMTKNHSEKLYSKNLQTIKFFGHSLGEADYSYFQSIFDGIDLYGSDVKLIFYYSRFHEHENDNNNEDELQYQRITKLLKRYGETRENIFHGKNLMHKLILEGRISIVDV